MSNTTRRARRTLDQLQEGLGQLDAFAEMLSGKRRAETPDPNTIDLVEVKPGVFAMPHPPRRVVVVKNRNPLQMVSLLERARQVLDQADELEARARELGREKPWQRR